MKKLILIRGPICSGKSSVAKLLFYKIGNSSLVDEDIFKRTIDRTKPSRWRSHLALEASLFLTEKLMKKRRTLIVDIHSSKKDLYVGYKKLAEKYGYILHSFLLYPPLSVCLERNRSRKIPGVSYRISDADIGEYWKRLIKVANEKIFSDPKITPIKIANEILGYIKNESARKSN